MTRSDTDNPPQQPVGKPPALDDLLIRVTGEYREMPGMCVTRRRRNVCGVSIRRPASSS